MIRPNIFVKPDVAAAIIAATSASASASSGEAQVRLHERFHPVPQDHANFPQASLDKTMFGQTLALPSAPSLPGQTPAQPRANKFPDLQLF